MTVFKTLTNALAAHPTAVALGLFDGVHIGHTAVLKAAANSGLPLCVFTFSMGDTRPQSKAQYTPLMAEDERFAALEKAGATTILCPRFDDFCNLSPREFVKTVLVGCLNARVVSCGYDFRFGKNGAGDSALLRQLGEEYGFATRVVDCLSVDGKPVSATALRRALDNGDMETFYTMSGRFWSLTAPVEHGNHLGTTLSFPTVNQPLDSSKKQPRFGVYASTVELGGREYPAVSNVGIKPTVTDAGVPLCETFLFGFSGDLYGKILTTRLKHFLRPEQKFSDLTALRAQIAADKTAAEAYFQEKRL